MYRPNTPPIYNYRTCSDDTTDALEQYCEWGSGTFYPGQRCCSAGNSANLKTYYPNVQQGCCTKDNTCITGVIDMGYYATCLGYQCDEVNDACNSDTCETVTTTTTVPATLIDLSYFTATPKFNKVVLQWSTEAENDNAGFNLYRSETEDGIYTKINDSLIPAQGSSTQGASYEFIDKDLKDRKTYYYKLEDIGLNGTSTIHGPVSATPRWIFGIGK